MATPYRTSEATRARQLAYENAKNARRRTERRQAEAAVRQRRLEAEQRPPDLTPRREKLEVEREAGAVFKPVPSVPLASRIKSIDRQIYQLQLTRRQLVADLAHEPA